MKAFRDYERTWWKKAAFIAYFGNQPISEIRTLSVRELNVFYEELCELVRSVPTIRIG